MSGVKVDLNPHQVDAALFALKSPLSSGALLADEVGLGKTIEAGLALAQYWSERRRRILLIVPASLRTQWRAELEEKFFIKSRILESANFTIITPDGKTRKNAARYFCGGKTLRIGFFPRSQRRLRRKPCNFATKGQEAVSDFWMLILICAGLFPWTS